MLTLEKKKILIQQVLNDYDDIALPYNEKIHWDLTSMESTSTYGYCYVKDVKGWNRIKINKHIETAEAFLQTVAHEIIHTIDGCDNHDRVKSHKGFHYWGDLVNTELPYYNIDTYVTVTDTGVKRYEESVSNWKMVSPMEDGFTWYAKGKTPSVKSALLGCAFKDTCRDDHTYSVYHKDKKKNEWVLVREADELL